MDFSKFDPAAFKGAGADDSDDEEEKVEIEPESQGTLPSFNHGLKFD